MKNRKCGLAAYSAAARPASRCRARYGLVQEKQGNHQDEPRDGNHDEPGSESGKSGQRRQSGSWSLEPGVRSSRRENRVRTEEGVRREDRVCVVLVHELVGIEEAEWIAKHLDEIGREPEQHEQADSFVSRRRRGCEPSGDGHENRE